MAEHLGRVWCDIPDLPMWPSRRFGRSWSATPLETGVERCNAAARRCAAIAGRAFLPHERRQRQVIGINGVVEEVTELQRIEEKFAPHRPGGQGGGAHHRARAASAPPQERILAHMPGTKSAPRSSGVLGLVQIIEKAPLSIDQRQTVGRMRIGRALAAAAAQRHSGFFQDPRPVAFSLEARPLCGCHPCWPSSVRCWKRQRLAEPAAGDGGRAQLPPAPQGAIRCA